jgi:hypothetical protein
MKPILKEFYKVENPTIYNTYFTWLSDNELRNQLIENVLRAKELRKSTHTQKEVSQIISPSLTKIKEIENGTCKDFNAINNYINYILS